MWYIAILYGLLLTTPPIISRISTFLRDMMAQGLVDPIFIARWIRSKLLCEPCFLAPGHLMLITYRSVPMTKAVWVSVWSAQVNLDARCMPFLSFLEYGNLGHHSKGRIQERKKEISWSHTCTNGVLGITLFSLLLRLQIGPSKAPSRSESSTASAERQILESAQYVSSSSRDND